ncbi:hypothetical protein XthCFBP4691_19140 [Xanthomonas theicola]|uniref:N-acetyltransferase domain-containing protein n=1 Tax=Xanthomonas theicola TaxID=56464 RepID=A0A2S6Z9P5_9XANT|nr:GNAT family N-acetyltransferase [Xanthomonas theicola]PPT78537.1 hypothetical protein XthCFBP4691_19140 [Xanthomonas theicola]QNH26489.1 GNAT family N-acetyltransferase [Xanthomonas theicola]
MLATDAQGVVVDYGDRQPDGHIDHLYCHPEMVGTGVGSAIYAEMETIARAAGIAVLFVEASEGARRRVERRGFTMDARNDFSINGVASHNYRMSKRIA